MTKLTPTFNDKIANNGAVQQFNVVPVTQALPVSPFQSFPLPQPVVEAPAEKKRGRKAKLPAFPTLEQKVNIAAPAAVVQPLKIALVGTAPSSRGLAPYGDPTWQIWACSPGNAHGAIPRFDVWFEIHGTELLREKNKSYAPNYLAWLKTLTCPLIMQDNILCPNALPYPLLKMIRQFGDEFFTSSFAYMMALAIDKGASEIVLYGIDMASREEYIIQRPGFYHFKKEGMKRGIKISAPHESDIMQSAPLYGYADCQPFGRKILAREDEIKERLVPMDQQAAANNENRTYLRGALEDVDYFKSIWMGVTTDLIVMKAENEELKEENRLLKAQLPPTPTAPTNGQG